MNIIIVEQTHNVHLSYTDSGPPKIDHSTPYTTIFAVHGWMFNGAVFKKLLPLCSRENIRFVSINRRGYPGSTDSTDKELGVFEPSTGAETESEKQKQRADYLKARGKELLTFVDTFIQKYDLPPISEVEGEMGTKKKCGGIAILGWSLGHSVTFATLANLEDAPKEIQTRLAAYLRAHILLEPAITTIGKKPIPGTWVATRDSPSITPASAIGLFMMLVSAYYAHGPGVVTLDPKLQTRDPTLMEHVAPAMPSRDSSNVPSVYNMTSEEVEEIISLPPRPVPRADAMLSRMAMLWLDILQVNYAKACYSETVRKSLLPEMKVVEILGDKTSAIVTSAFWQIWDDNENEKEKVRKITGSKDVKDFVEFKLMKGANHFMHWDYPQETMDLLVEILNE
ncbi:hypothetical protein E1B28_006529 [Marasmius oreades]|uniref:AB hydrolase-1 domain-containing protein n=1 Tax=Marasmius oreades TaxID=181124 RepID=A0A9P7S5L2_9AGAR|nr:uncharacterized protein E1B28_006529 [Marasmius oreades]KAG7095834.1 hypothetical protein E1B28_006529 [Marasmius oreades]